jgi:hypothetical protein
MRVTRKTKRAPARLRVDKQAGSRRNQQQRRNLLPIHNRNIDSLITERNRMFLPVRNQSNFSRLVLKRALSTLWKMSLAV